MNIIEQSHEILFPVDLQEASYGILQHLEIAGRTAYKSEDKITPESAEKFIRSIVSRGHESVIEHFSITVRFITDRGVTHEIVRHRLCSYTQESTRYCNYSKLGMTFIRPVFWEKNTASYYLWEESMRNADREYEKLINVYHAFPQEARSVLPNSLKTEIVCTANIREWRHILRLRTSPTAHPQMRALMLPLLAELKGLLPVLFDDITVAES